ncbi:CRISPR-associated endonuclease Cas1 [Thioalkalivibrio paradoxus]|uniref:CRISPR-associated endonuclease Cas1 n=1 Tax=Thioalkalivibrio paradoxus ARh 1 TaxID=713585 RepID=W0DIG1_9GAMM|nr:CRISPR-associated endonuclease Cas1 [Thioalkalivibrio paradoxus]AHE98419.1 CRISPR-associated protein Cas1 [Thioalkalivibrio paradoxus ARh 1]
MATLFLDRAQLELRTDGNALAVYEGGRRRGTVPLSLLERVVVQGRQTRFESGVLLKLAESGTATVFMGARSSRQVALMLGPRHNDAAVRIAQTLRIRDADYCARWARDLVAAKLRRQYRLLIQCERQRPDARKALFDARETLARIRAQLTDGSRDIGRLRGLEGAAARAYFAGLGAVFPPAVGFRGRNRRPPRDPANACLSLGYTLLHFDAVRAAHAAGLDPLIGFYHRPSFGRESLASDLIEPLRPVVDAWVWDLFRAEVLRAHDFNWDHEACLLNKAGRARFYGRWEPFARTHRRWLRLRCGQLARDFREQGETFLDPDGDDEAGET